MIIDRPKPGFRASKFLIAVIVAATFAAILIIAVPLIHNRLAEKSSETSGAGAAKEQSKSDLGQQMKDLDGIRSNQESEGHPVPSKTLKQQMDEMDTIRNEKE